MKNKKVQWHPGFVAAITLELKQNRENLLIQREHNLNTKPLEVDVLIIRKEKTEEIRNEIGKFSAATTFWNINHRKTIWMWTPFIR